VDDLFGGQFAVLARAAPERPGYIRHVVVGRRTDGDAAL
jgi:hypothetical protein